MNALKKLGYTLGLPVLLVLAWWVLTRDNTNLFVPKPGPVLDTFFSVWLGDVFMSDVVPSLLRLVVGLLLSIVLGIGFGVLIGAVQWIRWLTEPILEFIRAVPGTVLVPILLIVVGINERMQISIIVLACVWPILLNTMSGVRSLDEVLRDTARTFRVTGRHQLIHLTLPGASPQIMAGIRQSLAIGLIMIVVSEMFASVNGLGHTMILFQNRIAVPEMWSGILLLGVLGVLLSVGFQLLQRRILRWYDGLKEAAHAE